MTVELRHCNTLPQPMLTEGLWCAGCPHYHPGQCSSQCETAAEAAGFGNKHEYAFFDPLLYTTWRLTRA